MNNEFLRRVHAENDRRLGESVMNAIKARSEFRMHRNRLIIEGIEERHQKRLAALESPTLKTCPTCGKEL